MECRFTRGSTSRARNHQGKQTHARGSGQLPLPSDEVLVPAKGLRDAVRYITHDLGIVEEPKPLFGVAFERHAQIEVGRRES